MELSGLDSQSTEDYIIKEKNFKVISHEYINRSIYVYIFFVLYNIFHEFNIEATNFDWAPNSVQKIQFEPLSFICSLEY